VQTDLKSRRTFIGTGPAPALQAGLRSD
jgi:hypothetical protein